MADETDITTSDIAILIEDGTKDGKTSLEIAEVLAKVINDKWYCSRKDVCEGIIGYTKRNEKTHGG